MTKPPPQEPPAQTQRRYLYDVRVNNIFKCVVLGSERDQCMTKPSVSINTQRLYWMQTCVDADVTKHLRKDRRWWLSSYAGLPRYISVAVNRAIQLVWNKKLPHPFHQEIKKESKWMYHSFTIPFPSTPQQRCLQIAIIPPLIHIWAWTRFKRGGLFISPLAVRKFAP